MPKRSHKIDSSDYLSRKIRKIEKKLAKRKKQLHDQVSFHGSSVSSHVAPDAVLLDSEHEDERQVHLEGDLVQMTFDETQLGPSTSTAEASVIDALQTDLPTETGVMTDPPTLDDDILKLLGETPSKERQYGPNIQDELAIRWEHIATAGLNKDSKRDLFDKHLVPRNCTKIDAPKLNPEIKAALSEILIKKDKALETKQKQVAASISCISEALTRLFSLEHRDQTVIRLLIEAGRLMCDTQHNESMTRRSFICSTIKKDIKDQLFNTEIDGFLFGDKLADTLKAAKAISKSGAEIKINTSLRKTTPAQKPRPVPGQALNQKPPLPATRQVGAPRRFEPPPSTMPRQRQPPQQRQPPRSQHRPDPRR